MKQNSQSIFDMDKWLRVMEHTFYRYTEIYFFTDPDRKHCVRKLVGYVTCKVPRRVAGRDIEVDYTMRVHWTASGHCYQGKNRKEEFDLTDKLQAL